MTIQVGDRLSLGWHCTGTGCFAVNAVSRDGWSTGYTKSSKADCSRSFGAASTEEKDHNPFPWLCNVAVSKAGPC